MATCVFLRKLVLKVPEVRSGHAAGALALVSGDDALTRFVLVWTLDEALSEADMRAAMAAVWSTRRLNAVVVARTWPGGAIQVHDFNPFDGGE